MLSAKRFRFFCRPICSNFRQFKAPYTTKLSFSSLSLHQNTNPTTSIFTFSFEKRSQCFTATSKTGKRPFLHSSLNNFSTVAPSSPTSSSTKLIEITSVQEFEDFVKDKGPRAFVSAFDDPYLNLALEAYIFKNMPAKEESSLLQDGKSLEKNNTMKSYESEPGYTNNRLLFYVNKACVVIGRNQNPWRECNVPLLKSLGIPLLRRRSGGGTVVHDGGNINFSVMTSREDFTRDKHAKMIVNSINQLPPKVRKLLKTEGRDNMDIGDYNFGDSEPSGISSGMGSMMGGVPTPFGEGIGALDIPNSGEDSGLSVIVNGPQIKLAVNERYDIVDAKTREKVSGSAYKIERQRAYHHGTMLLESRLDVLKALLHRNPERLGTVEGRGVESVKSPVVNLGVDKDVFISTVLDAFANEYASEKKRSLFDDLIPIDHLESQPDEKKKINNCRETQATYEEFQNPLTAGIDYEIEETKFDTEENVVDFAELNDEMFGSSNKELPVMLVQPDVIPKEVYVNAKETMEWQWMYGQTPDFTHTLVYPENNPIGGVLGDSKESELTVKFKVSKGMLVGVELEPPTQEALTQFQFVKQMIGQPDGVKFNQEVNKENTSKVRYIGKEIGGYIPDDNLSQWVGNSIDGTQLQ